MTPVHRTRGRRARRRRRRPHAGDRHAPARVRGQGADRRRHAAASSTSPGTTRCSARSRSRSTCRRRWSARIKARRRRRRADRHLDAVRAGLKGFINEARLLARFDHPSLVKVYRFWEENGTAYMVMPYYEGPTLKAALAELGHVPSESELRDLAEADPQRRHAAARRRGLAPEHRPRRDPADAVRPGPARLRRRRARDRGDAPHAGGALKAGFAAIEQYGSAAATTRGPWTDLYALAAVIYAAITGSEPAPAADRLDHDRLRPLAIVAAGLYSDALPEPRSTPRWRCSRSSGRPITPSSAPSWATSRRPKRRLARAAPRPDAGAVRRRVASDREVTVPDRPLLAGASRRRSRRAAARPSASTGACRQVAADAGSVRRRRRDRRDAVVDAGAGRARPARQARALRRRRRHVRADRHRRARPPVRHRAGAGAPHALRRRRRSAPARRRPRRDADAAPRRRPLATAATRRRAAATAATHARPRRPHAAPRAAATAPVTADRDAPRDADRRPRRDRGDAAQRRRPRARRRDRRGRARPSPHAATRRAPLVATSRSERQARCTEILQKASLEKITAGRDRLLQAGMQMSGCARAAPRCAPASRAALALGLALVLGACSSSEPQTFEKALAEATDSLVGADRQAAGVPGPPRVEARQARSEAAQARGHDRSDARHDHRPADRDDGAVRAARRAAHRQPLSAVRVPAVPGRQPGARPVPADRHDVAGVDGDGSASRRAAPQLALTDLKTGLVVAQASALARDENLDHTPLALLPRQPGADEGQGRRGLRETSATPPGQRGDAYYLERIGAASVIHEATSLYNPRSTSEALGRYRSALSTPTGEQLRVATASTCRA